MISQHKVSAFMDRIAKLFDEETAKANAPTRSEVMMALGISFCAVCRGMGMNPRKVLQSITDEHGDTLDAVSKHPARTA
jgi:hypothetical protein